MVRCDRDSISETTLSGGGVSICIPAFNESAVIGEVLEGLRRSFPDAEIIVVDDASQDRTADVARGVNGVTVLSHERNRGYGGSVKTAMRHASGRIVAWFDGDGQHRPEDLKKVLLPIISGDKDAVIGARARGSDVRLDRLPGKMVLQSVAELVAGTKIPDLNSGLRAFRADVIRRYVHLLPDGFSASATSTLIMIKRVYRLGFESIVSNRRSGRSSVRIFRDGMTALHLILRILILFDAFRFFSLISFVQVVPGLAYGLFMAMTIGQGFPVLAAMIVISGVLTFLVGLVCDQLVELRKERFED
jgi:glycosyltransferase involved in cell wall biosynthesis